MKETYQKLFDDYTAKIDEFLALVRKAVHGDNDARGKINAMIADENGEGYHSQFCKNIFEVILEEIGETREKANLAELREKYITQMKNDFEFYPEGQAKMREEYGDGIGGILNRTCDPLNLHSENKEEYRRVIDIATKYPRLADLERSEHWEAFKAKVESGEITEDDDDEPYTASDAIGDAIGQVIAAPFNLIADGIEWLAEKIPVVG